MTVLHVLFLLGKKSAEDTLQTAKLLLDHGLRELINEADSLGNTPLHALIVRYALEEAKYGYGYGGYGDRHEEPQPWNKWDMLHIVRYLIHQVSSPHIRYLYLFYCSHFFLFFFFFLYQFNCLILFESIWMYDGCGPTVGSRDV